MAAAENEEWPQHSHRRQLVDLDQAAQCGICHSFCDAPLSLLCGHSFCAECLRSNIQYQEQSSGKVFCPQCRQAADSRQVVPNHQLRDLVKAYCDVRSQLVAAVRGQPLRHTESGITEQPSRKRRRPAQRDAAVIELESSPEPGKRELRKRNEPVNYYPAASDQEDESSESSGSEEDRQPVQDSSPSSSNSPSPEPDSRNKSRSRGPPAGGQSKLPANWVTCPCCTQNFPMAIFHDHLDKCLDTGSRPAQQPGKGSADAGRSKLKVPPKLLLAIEKDKSLRDRLRRYQLSTKGNRQELQQRYNRFRVEVQTAVDRCEAGATYASLARRVMSRETTASNAGANGLAMKSSKASKSSDAHGSNFDELIRATRARANKGSPLENGSVPPDEVQEPEQGDDREGQKLEEAPQQANGMHQKHKGQFGRRFGAPLGKEKVARPALEPSHISAPAGDASCLLGKEPCGDCTNHSQQTDQQVPLASGAGHGTLPWAEPEMQGVQPAPQDIVQDSSPEDSL